MKAGDRVQLKSGGPTMTVEAVKTLPDGTHLIHCVWFDHDHNEKRAQYPEAKLAEYIAKPPGARA